MAHEYDFRKVEERWQKHWRDTGLFRCDLSETKREPYYCLMMFPYPSGTLHMGHVINYTIGDVLVRSRLMMGRNVLSPMGWDAFGLPAENAAIKSGVQPDAFTRANIDRMRVQMTRAGWGYDWDREFSTSHPGYYKWTQWVFLRLYQHGLAARKQAPVNWCNECQTVLANEQVHGGRCERCNSVVEPRDMRQWFFLMSKYAQRLLDDHAKLRGKWPEKVIRLQEEWIGRSEGARIDFTVEMTGETLSCFTTRPDTVYGVTYMSVAPEHPIVERLVQGTPREQRVMAAVREMRRQSAIDRTAEETEKIGIDTGARVRNPATDELVPLWVASYALMHYGTGAVMAVPAHDQRDFLFARKYGLPIRVVIQPAGERLDPATMKAAHVGPGKQVNSGSFDGLDNETGKARIAEHLASIGKGAATVSYALRDWLLSRQRYWGAPIPIVHCDRCGEVPVPEKDLPVLLPAGVQDFAPKGKSPLAAVESFVRTKCPRCRGDANRETDTMDTFVDSSWYFLRYLTPRDEAKPFDRVLARKWMPIHQYVGGSEHSTMHLVYSRFLFKVLKDFGYLDLDEPAERLFCQGMVCQTAYYCAKDLWLRESDVDLALPDRPVCRKCGARAESSTPKMSKTKLNVTSPDSILEESGADCLRLAILSAGPPDQDLLYSPDVVTGARRFLFRLWDTAAERSASLPRPGAGPSPDASPADRALRRKAHQTLQRVTDALQKTFGFNTAISAAMELVNAIRGADGASGAALREALEITVRCLSPFAPHIAEELWERLGRAPSIFRTSWPQADPAVAAEEEIEVPIQVNGKRRSRLVVPAGTGPEDLERLALADPVVQKQLAGESPVRVIVVPGKLVNVVMKGK
ncbi:MAG: leucine--tRNA ligase [Planctomycetes bacterium]|nr:leucine--tRNA ligase [Planctomycetota bacterium]